MGTWRQHYAPMIAKIIADNQHLEQKELKKLLQRSNPGQYGWMRKTWANEYMRQLGLGKKKGKAPNAPVITYKQLTLEL